MKYDKERSEQPKLMMRAIGEGCKLTSRERISRVKTVICFMSISGHSFAAIGSSVVSVFIFFLGGLDFPGAKQSTRYVWLVE